MSEQSKPKKPPGRPRVFPSGEKRPTLTFRVRGGMHEQLKESAAENERSLSEEIETRLVQSFNENERRESYISSIQSAEDHHAWLAESFGGGDFLLSGFLFCNKLREELNKSGSDPSSPETWFDTQEKKDAAIQGIATYLPELLDYISARGGAVSVSWGKAHLPMGLAQGMRKARGSGKSK